MTERLRFLPAGSDALLVELGDLKTALTLLDALRADRPIGVIELVPAARTLLLRYDPLITDRSALVDAVVGVDFSATSIRSGETFDIPVRYDGEDLNDVAEQLGWSVQELIRRHTEAIYTVAFTGFAPGFAYMTSNDAAFDVPRRMTPRMRIPAGSVALAGKFGGIYPSDSPGGWQLLGRTPINMWDTSRPRAALLAPGDRVRFRNAAEGASVPVSVMAPSPKLFTSQSKVVGLSVTRADNPALFQDLGRVGHAGQGVSQSGALDRRSLIEANLCVGNPWGSVVIEIAYGGFAIRTDRPVTLALAGAPTPLTIRSADGRCSHAPTNRPFALDEGDELALGFPVEGTRSYLAIRGGFAVDEMLGSAATDTLAKIGPAPIVAGDILLPANGALFAVDPDRPVPKSLPKATDITTLDVVLGPRTDWFTTQGLITLLTQEWLVTADSSRVGIRLAGAKGLERVDVSELPSEGTPLGAVQVPHNGQPVLFLADHPLTGGYPVIAVVAAHHLDLASQIPIGARVRFNAIIPFHPQIMDTAQ